MRRDIAALAAEPHDLVIAGGGIYGVTAAFEASRRGLKVALVEADDFGAGASWNSLKTIHGGLRHLQRLDLRSHRESVRERRELQRLAPELVRPMPFLVPAYGHGTRGRHALLLGLLLHDLLSLDRNDGLGSEGRLPSSRMLGKEQALQLVPGLASAGIVGAALWHDAQLDSGERLILGFLRAAVEAGARVGNHCPALALLQEGGRAVGVRVRDLETGNEHDVRGRVVLDTAGPGAKAFLPPLPSARPPLGWLQALNLVLKGPWPLRERMGVGGRSGSRFLFLMPWRDRILLGTEYWPAEERRGAEAVERFRTEAARAFPWAGLEGRRVVLAHRGQVPGQGGPEGLATRPLLLDHEAEGGLSGLVSLRGVKYTTARAVVQRVVRLVQARVGRPLRTPPLPEPLPWARPLEGSLADRTLTALRDEMARTLRDAVLRRLDLGTAGSPPEAETEEVARVMAAELRWDPPRVAAERAALARFYEAAYNGGEAD